MAAMAGRKWRPAPWRRQDAKPEPVNIDDADLLTSGRGHAIGGVMCMLASV
jgi:hypothetical protein